LKHSVVLHHNHSVFINLNTTILVWTVKTFDSLQIY